MKNQKNRFNFTKSEGLMKKHQHNKRIATYVTVILTALTVILALAFTATNSMATTKWSENLLKNPGAESCTENRPNDWESHPGSGFSDLICNVGKGQVGNSFWAGREDQKTHGLYQDVVISQWKESIDTGTLKLKWGGYLSGGGTHDTATMNITMYDENNRQISLQPKKFEYTGSSWEGFEEINKIPRGVRKLRFWLGVYVNPNRTSPNNGSCDELLMQISVPIFIWVRSHIQDFGNLYYATNDTAKEYNGKQFQTYEFKNGGSGILTWEITDNVISGITIISPPVTKGTLHSDNSQRFNVAFNPPTGTSSPYDEKVVFLKTNHLFTDPDHRTYFKAKANIYGTPTVTHISPAKGSNGKVNAADGESVSYKVQSGPPNFPGATIQRFEWKDPLTGNWLSTGSLDKQNRSSTWPITLKGAGEKTVEVRMVDSNGVATAPVSIPAKVWNRPIVKTKPPKPEDVDWFDDTYVGVVGKDLKLQASGETQNAPDSSLVEGKIGKAMQFDGVADYVSTTDIDLSGDFTLMTWFNSSSVNTNYRPILSKQTVDRNPTNATAEFNLQVQDNGNLSFFMSSDENEYDVSLNGGVLSANTWYHVAIVMSSNTATMYLNSISKGDNTYGGTRRNGSQNMLIGRYLNQYWIGKIDEVSIWNRALSQVEIQNNMSKSLTGSETGLLYYNAFDSESIVKYDWLDDAGITLVKQNPGQVVTYQWDKQNLNGRIYCKAITNFGIESKKQSFNFKIYPILQIGHGGPYAGKPKKTVALKGSVLNSNGYPGATFQYEWIAQKMNPQKKLAFESMGESTAPTLEATWLKDGERIVKLKVTVATKEGLTITGSAETKVKLEAGIPTARPGGPYRGGIVGGNFTPVQFEGNRPDFVEDKDVGKIVKWEWGFGGPKDKALQFDGKDDYVNLESDSSLNITGDITVEAWVKTPSSWTENYPQIIARAGGGIDGFNLYIANAKNESDRKFSFILKSGNNSWGDDFAKGTSVAQDNTWYHVTGVREGNIVKIYVNGIIEGIDSGSPEPINYGSVPVAYIGRKSGGYWWNGIIDEVRIWNRALTQKEIQANAQDIKISSNEPGLVGYWKLDEGSGTEAKDYSSNGNHGTLEGKPEWITVDSVFLGDKEVDTVWNPTHAYPKAGEYTVSLRVQGEYGKWSPVKTTTVTVIDGKIEGYVKATDLRTPVKDVRLTLTSSHVDKAILANIGTLQSVLQFDGVDDYVEIAINVSETNYTVSLWFKTSDSNSGIFSVDKGTRGSGGYDRQIYLKDGNLYTHVYANEIIHTSGFNYADGKWHHVAHVFGGSVGGQQIFVDGELRASGSKAQSDFDWQDGINIGFSKEAQNSYFKGLIDEVSIWERALSQTEIQSMMQSKTLSGSESGLVGYWSFDEGRGTTAADGTPNGNDGNLYGNPQWFQFEMPLLTDSDGNVYTLTDGRGFYSFEHLPLGEYTISASKKEVRADGSSVDFHEFEKERQVTELTLTAPNQLGMDFVDNSVFPVGGRIVYSIQHPNKGDVFVKDVVIKAQPVGSTSAVESLLSSKSPKAPGQTNYSLPLFAGEYLFKAYREGHDVRLKGTHPDDTSNEPPPGYNKSSQLVTIKTATTDIDFIDYTTREITVYVEDSGGYPIDTYQDNKIKVLVSGDNGFVESEVKSEGGKTLLKATVPPGNYTVSLPNVPTAIVKGEKGETPKKEAEVDLTGGDGSVTMIVPVQIVLTVSPAPKLLEGLTQEQLVKLGIPEGQNPEGFMFYYPPKPIEHTYTIKATANGNPVEDFTLLVTDEISQLTPDPPQEQSILVKESEGTYKIKAGKPKLDRTQTPPIAAAKTVKFVAKKDAYTDSEPNTPSVTILGFYPIGDAAEIESVPVVNYLVLHDPPGDESYAYFDDSMMVSGAISDMKIKAKDGTEISVYPAPWSVEREIEGVTFGTAENPSDNPFQDLGTKGLLGYESDPDTVGDKFWPVLGIEAGIGAAATAASAIPGGALVAYAGILVKHGITAGTIGAGKGVYGIPMVQYSISPSRHLQTPSGDELPDLLGPGKGDIYFGEGWTLGLQSQYLLSIEWKDNQWKPVTTEQTTYDILERTNQYVYTIRDIENLIEDLDAGIPKKPGGSDEDDDKLTDKQKKLKKARDTWKTLLNDNLAYKWQEDLRKPADKRQWESFDKFREGKRLPADDSGKVETLIFSAGPAFEYSRTITQSNLRSFSTGVSLDNSSYLAGELQAGLGGTFFGVKLLAQLSTGILYSLGTSHEIGTSVESGQEVEQTVGFVLQDDDVGDHYATRVYTDPQWGTPLFFADAGSVTSDPWEPGTNKAVDVEIELVKEPTRIIPFDYHDGAHYKVKISYAGKRELESEGVYFIAYAPHVDNQDGLTIRFNGMETPYGGIELSKTSAVVPITLSLYPPAIDMENSAEKEYSVVIEVQEEDDNQISRRLPLKVRFADLRAPRATIIAPYDGQRISPEVFKDDKKFKIEVFSDDHDVAKIQLEIRSKQTDGVWEPWRILSGIVWEDGGSNENVIVVTHSDRDPVRWVFTFEWKGAEIADLGVGEYALRAVAQDKATRLKTDGSQEAKPNVDLDAPVVTFQVDGSKPTVLTTIPNYQARESERIYRGELSTLFNDDMRAGDFSDRTFYVTDLLNNSEKIAGFVSYSPALRKAIFVPVVPFQPNGFFRVEIKTETEKDGKTEKGVYDLAGNPLDNAFMFTFRTTDAPFEETWSIILAATDGTSIDANNIAAVAYGALDVEDEKDARAVPHLDSQLDLSFLDRSQVNFDRDTRPADGRLGHHWFFAIKNAQTSPVQIFWNPSIKLRRDARQYQVIRLVEFDADGNVTNTKNLDPKDAPPTTQFPIGEGALQFDGSSSVTVNHHASLNHDGEYTAMAWVYLENEGDYPQVLGKSDWGSEGPTQYQIQLGGTSRKPYGVCGGDGGRGGSVNSNTALELNQWYHLAYVVTYDDPNSTLKIYLNGNLDKTGSQPGKTHNATSNLGIGGALKGKVDEVAIFNRALTPEEIQVNMNRSLTGNEEGLIGYWPFDEGSGTTTADKSPNSNNGTLNNGPTWVAPPKISGALAYEYTPAQGEAVRFFRLDVQKIGFVATTFEKGSSGWKFLSVPITPQRADPFVNLGDDIDPFKLYKYDTKLNGYRIYPLDIGEVSLQTGHGYFTRLEKKVEVDVGGPSNLDAKTLELDDVGWHAIGNPFVKPVNVADLQVKKGGETKAFAEAVTAGWVEGTLYRWKIGSVGAQPPTDAYEAVTAAGDVKQLDSWDGYWFKTKFANLTLIIPAPAGLANYIPPLPPSFDPPMAPSEGGRQKAEGGIVNAAGQFEMKLALTSDFASDLTTTLGTRQNAKVSFDRLDQSEPPRLNHTVSAYFDHSDWEEATVAGRRYNIDYQSLLEIGQPQVWKLVAYTDKPKAKMRLSWEKAIEKIPSDIMLSIRKAEVENTEWQDMRQVRFIDLDTQKFITKVTFEIRAERFEMAPLEDLKVIAGEKQVTIKWTASDNPFITGYTITRNTQHVTRNTKYEIRNTKYEIPNGFDTPSATQPEPQHEFIDTDVEEEATYTYQVSVHFKSGADLKSNLFTVTVLPVIKKTVLLQSYPNPFNPDTWIPYELKKESRVTIEIYNVAGQLVRTLELGPQPRGRYISKEKAAYWNGRNQFGERATSGIYFYVMRADKFAATRKMVILK